LNFIVPFLGREFLTKKVKLKNFIDKMFDFIIYT